MNPMEEKPGPGKKYHRRPPRRKPTNPDADKSQAPRPVNPNQPPKTEKRVIRPQHLQRAPVKKIRHYFFEFLMLFLAVFCGFMAENWREELREHRREKEFIRSIVDDLKSDSVQSGKTIAQLQRIHIGMDSVTVLLASPEIMNNSNEVYRLWTKYLGLEVFVSNDRTIQQLKNNGELRLIRNKAVSDRIMKYDQVLKKYYRQSDLMYSAARDLTTYGQLFDFIALDKNPGIPVPLTEEGKRTLNHAYANVQLWNRGLIGLINWLREVNEEGKSLVKFIKQEYRLEGK
jgi:hypothetical protein